MRPAVRNPRSPAPKQYLGKGRSVCVAMRQAVHLRAEIRMLQSPNVRHPSQSRPSTVAKLPVKRRARGDEIASRSYKAVKWNILREFFELTCDNRTASIEQACCLER